MIDTIYETTHLCLQFPLNIFLGCCLYDSLYHAWPPFRRFSHTDMRSACTNRIGGSLIVSSRITTSQSCVYTSQCFPIDILEIEITTDGSRSPGLVGMLVCVD